MKILKAHESPISLMDSVQSQTDYDYALVHHFEKHEDYYNFFVRALNVGREVILDNSIFELKSAFDPKEYIKWIDKLMPTYYIVPDVLEDGTATVNNFLEWISNNANAPGMRIGTVQGFTYNEIVECYKFMSDYADYIAISFDMKYYELIGMGNSPAERRSDGRPRLIDQLINDGYWNWKKPHHLLGCSLAKEFKHYKCNNIYNIRSADTSNPVIAGIKEMRYYGDNGLLNEIHLADNEDIIDKDNFSEDQKEAIRYNITEFNNILNGHA